jgi:hypothetical protein
MATRITHETIYVRHDFTDAERLQMGSELAEAHTHLSTVEDEFKNVKAQFAERLSGVNTRIGSLSRQLAGGFEMRNVRCELQWDTPNVGEVSYRDPEGFIAKVRAMAPSEHQMELELAEAEGVPIPPAQEIASVEKSAAAMSEFFDTADKAQPSADDLDAVAQEEAAKEATSTTADEFF